MGARSFGLAMAILAAGGGATRAQEALDAAAIGKAAGAAATAAPDGTVRLAWARTDVAVHLDGALFPPAAGLGSWAALMPAKDGGAMVMGDTVVFEDEVDAALDAAFAGGLDVTALHNHFMHDAPHVYFMHLGGRGEPGALAAAVGGVWQAIRAVREKRPQPADRFDGAQPEAGSLDVAALAALLRLPAQRGDGGVVKFTLGRSASMHGMAFDGSLGLTTWAAFWGGDERAGIVGDFAMTAGEVQRVLRALRAGGLHVVALHNHMIGEEPAYFFTHFQGRGTALDLARAFRGALDAQVAQRWDFDEAAALPAGWRAEGTNQKGPVAAWQVLAVDGAPSAPHVLALTDPHEGASGTFNLCWSEQTSFLDGTIEVRVLPVTGDEDRGGGPIWRAQDRDNYYVARWNPLEDNYRLYYVRGGERMQLATSRVRVPPGTWHTLKVRHQGTRITCFFDGEKKMEVDDATFLKAGGVGLWTKADAATRFDDFVVTPER